MKNMLNFDAVQPVLYASKLITNLLVQKLPVECSPGVNFTNILHAAFTYVSSLGSFFVLTFKVCTLLAQDCWRKSCV